MGSGSARRSALNGRKRANFSRIAQELCEIRDGRPGLPIPNQPDELCGGDATLKRNSQSDERRNCFNGKVWWGRGGTSEKRSGAHMGFPSGYIPS